MIKQRGFAALALLASLLVAMGNTQAQTESVQYFQLTGHTVRGEFLRFFNARGGVQVFGYPITEELAEGGRQFQCFQYMRLDLYPENPEALRVRPAPIGELLERAESPISPVDIPLPNDPDHRYFPQTGHKVSFAFLNFFNQHGGLDLLGYPITDFKLENGRIVQYFQNARLEWHPDMPVEQRVRFGNLGESFAALRLDPSALRPLPANLAPQSPQVMSLKPIASLRAAVTGRTGAQTVHVYVMDQQGNPVQNAAVVAVVNFPTGAQTFPLAPTDRNGYTAGAFDLGQLTPGRLITVDVRVGFATLSAFTRTSFLVWW